jgi:RimJ/RimL family protein N-acetyltransferase
MADTPPILRDIPDQIESERLILRPPRPGDGALVNTAIHESLAELRPWMPWAMADNRIEDSEIFARRAAADYLTRQALPLLIFRKDDGKYIGGAGMHSIDWDIPHFELGYWVRTSEVGKGYAVEAVNAEVKLAFEVLGAERCEIRCDGDNERSAAVALRAGFTQEARLRRNRHNTSGQLVDTLIFGMIRADWLARQGASSL